MIHMPRTAFQALTWRNMVTLQLLGQVAIYFECLEFPNLGAWMGHPSAHYVAMALNVCLVVPVALLSDEAVMRGVASRFAYPIAIVATLPIALIAIIVTQHAYLSIFGFPADKPDMFWLASIDTSFRMWVYGAFAMLIFMNQRTADRILGNFRNSELRRVQLERQLVASRLATTEAQIDPTMLFNQLAAIKLGFQRGDDHTEDKLDELIQALRTALARTLQARELDASTPP